MEIVSKEFVGRLKEEKMKNSYPYLLSQMETGTALCISMNEWRMRTPIPYYFLRFNKGRKIVSVIKYGNSYYIIKL